jgi:heterodisulfide reductase subunit A
MKVGVYFCNCGANIADRIDSKVVEEEIGRSGIAAYFATVDFMCSGEGKEFLRSDVAERKPDRIVIAACSPRDYESAFRQALSETGMNPYLMQMINIREQVAWVTPEALQATRKACTMIRAALHRVALHTPLVKQQLEVCPDVVVIGAGPAGLKAALKLAEAGRKVTLVEKTPVLGGLPVRFEELYPGMECGPCMIEPILADVLHGPDASRIEVLTLAELEDVAGYYGNFDVKIRQKPRFVDAAACVGCGECIAPCPVTAGNEFNYGMNERKAIAFPFSGALPNAPFLDAGICIRKSGKDCSACQAACPVEGAINLDDVEKHFERKAGAIVLAVGASLLDSRTLPALGHGSNPAVVNGLEFERILASNGPTGGEITTPSGKQPETLAIVHCVGSLDSERAPYCSGVCCGYALKFNHLIASKLPGAKIFHLYREMVMPGKQDYALWEHARKHLNSTFLRYSNGASLEVVPGNGHNTVRYCDTEGNSRTINADMVVLCPAVVPSESAGNLHRLLEVPLDSFGFFEELHTRLDSAQSRVRGYFIAGACQAPMDIQKSMSQGTAAAGYILSGLADGKKLDIEPITASVDEERCSGCRTCRSVCPYKAISYPAETERARVNALLCQGCGTCVAACPAGAIRGNHFTNEQILAELRAILQ